MSEVRDLPVINSDFAQKTTLEEVTWPDRTVDGDFTTQTVRDWLTHHGYENGKRVNQADIISGRIGTDSRFFLAVKVWYHDPASDKKFIEHPSLGNGEVAWERRITPLLCLPGSDPADTVTFDAIKAWLEPYGVGKRIARPIHLADVPPVFSVTEWHLEDGKIGLRTTHIRGSFTPEERGETG